MPPPLTPDPVLSRRLAVLEPALAAQEEDPWWGLDEAAAAKWGLNISAGALCPGRGGACEGSGPTTCSATCAQHGTCNEDLGRCDCPVSLVPPPHPQTRRRACTLRKSIARSNAQSTHGFMLALWFLLRTNQLTWLPSSG